MKSLHNEVRCRQLPLLSLGVENSGVWPLSECQECNHLGYVPLQPHYYYSILFLLSSILYQNFGGELMSFLYQI
jgi:hypothetical protein